MVRWWEVKMLKIDTSVVTHPARCRIGMCFLKTGQETGPCFSSLRHSPRRLKRL